MHFKYKPPRSLSSPNNDVTKGKRHIFVSLKRRLHIRRKTPRLEVHISSSDEATDKSDSESHNSDAEEKKDEVYTRGRQETTDPLPKYSPSISPEQASHVAKSGKIMFRSQLATVSPARDPVIRIWIRQVLVERHSEAIAARIKHIDDYTSCLHRAFPFAFIALVGSMALLSACI